ncbi:MAG TPA: SDR family NAD(P)-dependent oxidoreductase, partial [Candidatus Thermoplasmatota archaeon]|nr:SDR family NAD(P)-dependent oxidoreductase [Candidatus Thermoplasmatota archaeon]
SVETIVSPASKPGTTRATRRYVVHYAPLPERAAATHSVEGRTLLVWAAPNYRADLVHELGRRGATAVSLDSLPATWDEARSRVEDLRRSHPRIHGLMFVPQPSPGGTDFSDDGLHAVKALFWILKGILTTGKSGEFEFFATGTTMGGDFATRPLVAFNPLEGGLVGIAKALRREIPNAQCKAVDFPPRVAPKTLAGTLLDELLHRDEWVEVGTLGGRGTLKLAEEELSEEEPGLDLSAKDVLVVTGGGAGITSDVCLGLAQRWKPSFLLLGRTQLPNNVEELARKSPQELAQLKSKILEDLRARGERGTPVQVEREFGKVQKIVEVHQTLERLRGMGCAVAYRACDVTDAKAVQRAVDEGRRALGAVTGIIHAAGLEESKLIVDKTPESFNRVFDAKVLGARNLLAATREDPVRFLVNFSSIAGRVGNAGQADYSAANDVLAKIGLALRHEKGATFPSVTVDWSAWGEKGMATRGSIMTVLTAAGVTPIPLQAGVQALVDEIAHGMRDAEVLVGAELGALADPKLFALRSANGHGAPTNVDLNVAAPKPQAQSGGQTTLFLESPRGAQSPAILDGVVNEDERSIVTRMVLDPARDPYLRDHSVDGVPYLPGVFGIEAFAETASRLAPGLRFIGARNIEYQLPVKVLRNQPVEVTIHASVANTERDHTEVGCRLQSVFVNAKGERLGAPRIHFTGTLLFGKAVEAETDATPAGMGPPIEAKEIYRQFFHGPSFQVLDSFQSNAEHKESVGVYAWPQAPLFGRSTGAFLTNPMGRELAYQTAGGYDLFVLRALSLPKAVGRIRFHDVPRPGERIVAVARYRDTHDNVSHFDVKLLGDRGRVLEELEDFELVRIKNLEPPASATLYRARWGHDFPLPLPGARAVLVRQPELAQLHVTAEEALTAGERADQERYRNEKRAREFFAGRLAAKEAIALLTERPLKESRGIEIRRLETGEPAARGKGTENIVVSITHTGDVALAVAARKESLTTIGIDAERIEEKPAAFTDEAFAPEEQQLLKRLVEKGAPSGQTQVLCWAVKEAVLKALGKGFALDVQDVRIESIEVEGACQVKLEEPARKCLAELGARQVHVQTWVRDEHAYALCWTTP